MHGFLRCDYRACYAARLHGGDGSISIFYLPPSDPGPTFPEPYEHYIRRKAADAGWTVGPVPYRWTAALLPSAGDICPQCSQLRKQNAVNRVRDL